MSWHKKPFFFTILLVSAMISWGVSWASGKVASSYTEPEIIIFWRFLATFISLFPVVLIFKESFRLTLQSFVYVALGAVIYLIYNQLFFTGLKTGFAGAGGVLVTTLNPIITFALTLLAKKHKLSFREGVGLGFGVLGGIVLLELYSGGTEKIFMAGNSYFLLSSFVWALLTITGQKSREKIHPIVFSFYVYLLSTVFDFFLALPYDINKALRFDSIFWWNIFYLSVISTTFGTTVYFFASGKLGSHRASTFIFIVPFTALISSHFFLGEALKVST
ncbi:MAG: DMT family transporter, partial [Leptospiraceae bacterium]|nr:DMT family transporter [Leptospiraceae bacterium]